MHAKRTTACLPHKKHQYLFEFCNFLQINAKKPMIYYFSASNFKSFHNPLTLDFRLTAGEPDDHLALLTERGDRVSTVLAVLGANASGKSNAIRALVTLADIAADSFLSPPDSMGPLLAHDLHQDEASTFEIEFEAGDKQIYRYTLALSAAGILSETLKVKGTRAFRRVFERQDGGDDAPPRVVGAGRAQARELRRDVTLLSWCAQHNVTELMPVWRFFRQSINANIDLFGRYPSALRSSLATSFFCAHPERLRQAVAQLQRWDIDVSDIEFDERTWHDGQAERRYSVPIAVHRRGERVIRRELAAESSGTQSLFALLGAVLPALHQGGLAVIDELETDLHPHMRQALLDLFLQPELNPHRAQLLCTTHAAELISQLHQPQIVLVEKRDGYSEAWSLRDMQGVGRRDNFAAKYLAGAYGGVPEL